MKNIKTFEKFNPALYVPSMLNMLKKKKKVETQPVDTSNYCQYKKITIGKDINFVFNDVSYKLVYDFNEFHQLMDVGKDVKKTDYLCKYIDMNKENWIETQE